MNAQTLAYPLSAGNYTDARIFARERQRIFQRTWQYAGHASDLQKPGDYFTFEIAGQSLFCVLDQERALHCFYNVCQHRAHALVSGQGNRRMLVCPYHGWAYELSGPLRAAPNDKNIPGFRREDICLTPVRVERFCGFIFVNLDPGALPMADWYPRVEQELNEYVPDIERLRNVGWVEAPEHCNWKVSVENYSECYHCRLNHPTFATGVVDPNSYNIAPQGHCLRHTTRSVDLDRLSYPIDPQANAHAVDYSSWFIWPAFSFQVYPGNILNTYLWRPVDPEYTQVYRGWYTVDGVQSEIVTRLAEQDRDTTVAEDIRLVESVQRGLNSPGYRPGPLIVDPNEGVNSEHSLLSLQEWFLEAMGDSADGAKNTSAKFQGASLLAKTRSNGDERA